MTAAVAPETLDREGGELVVQVQTVTVVDDASFERAGELLKTVKAYLARVADVFDPMVKAAHDAHKAVQDQRKKVEAHALEAAKLLKEQMGAYQRAVERKRREAEEARRREQERLEREERERVEAERRRLEKEEEDRRVAAAAAAEKRGDGEGARKLIEDPVVVTPPAPRPVFAPPAPVTAPPKVAGVSFREEWSAEVIDLMSLVRAVANGQRELGLLMPNQTALNQMARALRGGMAIPGVRAVSRQVTAVRSR